MCEFLKSNKELYIILIFDIIVTRKESLMAFFKRAWDIGSQVGQNNELALSVKYYQTMKRNKLGWPRISDAPRLNP